MISYEWRGRGRTPILFLHGVGMSRSAWDRLVPSFEDDFALCLPDLRGHGGSEAASPDTTLADLAADMAPLLAEPAHVVGLSLGAMVATQLALDWPDRVRSLCLVSSVCNRSAAQREAVGERYRQAREEMDTAARAAVARWFSPDWLALDSALADELLEQLKSNDRESYLSCYRIFATADALLWPRLGEITAPVLAITGADDGGSTPDMSRLLASTVRRGRAMVVPGVRHLLPLEAPEVLAHHLRRHLDESATELRSLDAILP
ncbi:alpha/beta fold hydrolase [Planosporangium flavigriseum]|uniref:AB hydrolase-1 domain-containing protein n=1 Tax=Planosporangium flavigriseum TaxID=373681 RepID=A0A8J3LM69_9ACTN|nr:alpha/beta hydrolase [Planosporangium flavigriseum]NJC63050.1 alpha/beta fold hydrolase [Planosporangium flavigriseum]GIG73078.1 hypothetical protein Pfl04_14820 [Planosporangium flavigriseum]